jgi:hypothetical protein
MLEGATDEPVQIADLTQQPSTALYEIILRAGFRAVLRLSWCPRREAGLQDQYGEIL